MVSCLNRRTILSLPLLCLALVVAGCTKPPAILQESSTKTIFFSTKDFKFYDLGFVKSYTNQTNLEIFNAGVALLKMECFKNKICLNQQCYAKASVVRRFFGNDAFVDLDFIALLEGKEILNGENKQGLPNGFAQTITRGNAKLSYSSTQDAIKLHIQNNTKTTFQLEIQAN